MLDQIVLDIIYYGMLSREKTGLFGENSQTADPLPPSLGTPCYQKQIMFYFAFEDLRNIFGLHKKIPFGVVN